MGNLKLTLLENSHSFVNEALSKAILAEKDSHQWQFAIFALVQAIELSLKERLRKEHPVLIFENVDKRKHTVGLEQAAIRLREISNVSITDSDINAIQTAIQWRNLVVHYEFEFSTEKLKPVFAKLLGFLTEFHKSHLGVDLADHVNGGNWKEAIAIDDYAKALFERAQKRIKKEHIDRDLI